MHEKEYLLPPPVPFGKARPLLKYEFCELILSSHSIGLMINLIASGRPVHGIPPVKVGAATGDLVGAVTIGTCL